MEGAAQAADGRQLAPGRQVLQDEDEHIWTDSFQRRQTWDGRVAGGELRKSRSGAVMRRSSKGKKP